MTEDISLKLGTQTHVNSICLPMILSIVDVKKDAFHAHPSCRPDQAFDSRHPLKVRLLKVCLRLLGCRQAMAALVPEPECKAV